MIHTFLQKWTTTRKARSTTANLFGKRSYKGNQMGQNVRLHILHTPIWHQTT